MNNRDWAMAGFLWAASAGVLGSYAWSDVTLQESASFRTSSFNLQMTTTRRISGDKQRTDAQMSCNGLLSLFCRGSKSLEVVRVDRGVTWTLQQKRKAYAEAALPTPAQLHAKFEQEQAFNAKLQSCLNSKREELPDSSKCPMTDPVLSVDKTSNILMILGHETQQTNLTLTQTCKSTNPGAACRVSYLMEVWLTGEDLPGIAEQRAFQNDYDTKVGLPAGSVGMLQMRPLPGMNVDNLQQLGSATAALKGYPLKTTFRIAYSGQCNSTSAHDSTGTSSGVLAGASQSAASQATTSSTVAARWGTSGAVEHATGGGLGGYVAGSAAGGFAESLVGSLFAKKRKPDTVTPTNTSPGTSVSPDFVTVAEFTVETVGLDSAALPADQFEIPLGWKQLAAKPVADIELPNCRT